MVKTKEMQREKTTDIIIDKQEKRCKKHINMPERAIGITAQLGL